jgi:AraC-like DNA-binding protein/ligand-binding sensor protein
MKRIATGGVSIFLDPEVRGLFDAFSRCFDIRIGYFTPDGRELAVGCGRECSEYCSYLRGELGLLDTCLSLDSKKRSEALETGDLVSYTCHGGMVESILPINYDDILHGFVMIGQFRSHRDPPERIRAAAGGGRPTEYVRSLYRETPRFTPEKIGDINNLFTGLVRYISGSHMIRYRNDVVVDRIIALLEREMHRNVSLEEAAAHVGRSVSTVSHLFTDSMGVGFKRYSIELKLRRAEELLESGENVYRAAAAVGYGDPYYFSRLFRKFRGVAPSRIGPAAVSSAVQDSIGAWSG